MMGTAGSYKMLVLFCDTTQYHILQNISFLVWTPLCWQRFKHQSLWISSTVLWKLKLCNHGIRVFFIYYYYFFFCGAATHCRSWPPHSGGFLDHTQRHTKVGRTPLDEWSACRRDLYLTTHNTHNRQTSMPPVGFEPTISAGEQPQTYALDRAATGTGYL